MGNLGNSGETKRMFYHVPHLHDVLHVQWFQHDVTAKMHTVVDEVMKLCLLTRPRSQSIYSTIIS